MGEMASVKMDFNSNKNLTCAARYTRTLNQERTAQKTS